MGGGVLVSCSWARVVPLKREAGHLLRSRGGGPWVSSKVHHPASDTAEGELCRARGRRPGRKRSGSATRAPTASPSARARALPPTPASAGGKVISLARPGEPRVSFCIPRTQINQPAPYPEMAILPRNLHICILPFLPEFNFLQELILITLFKQRGFGVYTNMAFFFPRGTHRIFRFLFFNLKGQ